MIVTLRKHPQLDFFIGIMGGSPIPTKQDKFKPILADKVIIIKGDSSSPLEDEFDLYAKKKINNSQKEFEDFFKNKLLSRITDEHPFPLDQKLEVIISISMTQSRINNVDIDNLAKSVLDCFTGTIFTDDSQVVNLYATKNVNPVIELNSLMVGIRKINNSPSWFDNIKLAYFENE